jgi:alpha-amylase
VQQAAASDPAARRRGVTTRAQQELYRAQCNCSYWHGAFGGLYLPHLRNAVYHHLIAAENAVVQTQEETVLSVDAKTQDFNLDARPEVCLSNTAVAAYFCPHRGGMLYELDLRTICHNLLATLSRRPEAYHQTILEAAGIAADKFGKGLHEQVKFKQPGLERLLQYDRHPRKSLLDHFYAPDVTLADLVASRETELGDFATGVYTYHVRQSGRSIVLTMRRDGQMDGHGVHLVKAVSLEPEQDRLLIRYALDNLPRGRGLRFAVEFNFAGMAAGADDRYFYFDGRRRAGQLQTVQDVANTDKIGLVDEWLGLDVSLGLSRPGGIWAFPIQTVSQSEGGFELVHQSTAVLPHWLVEADAQGRWEVTLDLKLDMSRAESRMLAASRTP